MFNNVFSFSIFFSFFFIIIIYYKCVQSYTQDIHSPARRQPPPARPPAKLSAI